MIRIDVKIGNGIVTGSKSKVGRDLCRGDIEDKSICSATACEGIVAIFADDTVGSLITINIVVPRPTVNRIVFFRARQNIVMNRASKVFEPTEFVSRGVAAARSAL